MHMLIHMYTYLYMDTAQLYTYIVVLCIYRLNNKLLTQTKLKANSVFLVWSLPIACDSCFA